MGHVTQNKQVKTKQKKMKSSYRSNWSLLYLLFWYQAFTALFFPLISCQDWQPMTHLRSLISVARNPAYSSSSPSCALITRNKPNPDPMSKIIFKAPGKSKARKLSLISVDIAIIEALKSDILSILFSGVTVTVQGKAIVSGPGENSVQPHQNYRSTAIRTGFDSSSPENQTGKPMRLPVASHAQGQSPRDSFSGQQSLNYFLNATEYAWIQWMDTN